MKRHILCISVVLLASLGVLARTTEKNVERIRTYYTGVAEKSTLAETDDEHGQTGELFMNELVVNKLNHQWRAVGIHKLTYKFFYKGGETEARMYPDQLVLVKVLRNESDRTYTEEYLYSETGVLMFYFQKAENDEQSPAERRVYFSGVNAVRVVEDDRTRDKLVFKDSAIAKAILAESEKIKGAFSKSLKLG